MRAIATPLLYGTSLPEIHRWIQFTGPKLRVRVRIA